LAALEGAVPSEVDGWTLMVEQVSQVAEKMMAEPHEDADFTPPVFNLSRLPELRPPEKLILQAGYSLELVRRLGRRTAEMHAALVGEEDDPDFSPESFTPFYQRSLYQSFRNLTDKVLQQLKRNLPRLAEDVRPLAEEVIASEVEIQRCFAYVKGSAMEARRIRIHGDYHLGQVLFSGEDFYVIDFEGEPARNLEERRRKRSPFKDVAGMLRSFDYAAEFCLKKPSVSEPHKENLRKALKFWAYWAGVSFLQAYFERLEGGGLLSSKVEEIEALLEIFVLEKALYEVGYELRSRPDWVGLPLHGILQILQRGKAR
jgi:maltose alpha-D-glucosyltransferase/alpha-amylase